MVAGVDEDGVLAEVWLPGRAPRGETTAKGSAAVRAGLDEAIRQLGEYFARTRRTFDLRIEPRGSDFERRIWMRLCDIPYGRTTSYGALAAEFGLTNGARAVGRANGCNPIPIVIPCHRVIGGDGSLVGFGGGLALKRALLELEGALPQQPALF
jgi:methylated-DNA-[protein]-cysteine S-methyltransferase